MSLFVLDNSVTMPWCFTEEATSYTEDVLNRLTSFTGTAIVPSIWLYEATNVITLAVRKGRIPENQAADFLSGLADLPIEIEPSLSRRQAFTILPDIMRRYQLTAYDAAYFELASRRKLPLATLDDALVKACKQIGHALV